MLRSGCPRSAARTHDRPALPESYPIWFPRRFPAACGAPPRPPFGQRQSQPGLLSPIDSGNPPVNSWNHVSRERRRCESAAGLYNKQMGSRTIYSVLEEAARKHADLPALHQPLGNGKHQTYSWIEYKQAVQEIACGLRHLGIGKGDIVALQSETRAEFYLADLRS